MRKRNRAYSLKILAVVLAVILALLVAVAILLPKLDREDAPPATEQTTQATTQATTDPTTEPTEPPIEKIATATIGATGDVLLHQRVIDGGKDPSTGTYNYDNIFTYFNKYVQQMDYSVANMEGTLCGTENGYSYTGYPCFNVPDAIVDALKTAGFQMLLTANNHSYDTRNAGFMRTQQVIADRGVAYIGTMPDTQTLNYRVEDINGIKVGMTCYTYQTGVNSKGNKTLNGIGMSAEDSALINSFDYNDLNSFYSKLEGELAAMRAAGAECTVLFIHWGDEYKTTPNSWQKKMSQALCNLGVDVIVGGHAHVVQPIEVLTNENDPSRTTLCLYSMGNAVSNIRKSDTRPAHCEDGMLFSFTLAKYSDGSVILENTDVLSTWVNRYTSADTGREVFAIIPLDTQVEDWKSAYALTDSALTQAERSLERSRAVLAEGLESAKQFYAQKQLELEQKLGIQPQS